MSTFPFLKLIISREFRTLKSPIVYTPCYDSSSDLRPQNRVSAFSLWLKSGNVMTIRDCSPKMKITMQNDNRRFKYVPDVSMLGVIFFISVSNYFYNFPTLRVKQNRTLKFTIYHRVFNCFIIKNISITIAV